jgi:conjugation system TraG family ATPase
MTKYAQLDERLPILEVASDAIVSKTGDVTVALELDKPEIFTLGVAQYEILHQAYVKALKVLPEGTMVHFQDVYLKRGYKARNLGDSGMLAMASERFFDGRPCLEHRSMVFITRRPAGRRVVSSATSGLLRSVLVPEGTLSRPAFHEFEDKVAQFSRILVDSGLMQVRRIPAAELVSSAGEVGVIEQYCYLLDEGATPLIRDIDLGARLRVGDQECMLFTLADAEHLPKHCAAAVNYEKYGSETTRFPVGFAAGLGLLLPVNHIYNQYILIGDQAAAAKKLETKRLRLQSMAKYSRGNRVGEEALNGFLNEMVGQQRVVCRAHFNVLAWTDEPGELKEIRSRIGSAMAAIDAVAHEETVGAPQLWWAGIPGNAGDLPENECHDTFLEQACCFLAMETNYRSSESEFGLRFGDRLTGYPVNVDIDVEPRRLGLTGNNNMFVLSGSGGGKSYLMAHICRSYIELGFHVVVVDVGRSYETLCRLMGGVYLTYEEANPIRFNPFYVPGGGEPDLEKKESIKSLLMALWKRADEEQYRSEYVTISAALRGYYAMLAERPEVFPCFDSFYDYMEGEYAEMLRGQGVKAKEFNLENFLYVLRPYSAGGEFDFLLNARENLDLLSSNCIVFELSNIAGHPILLTVVTMVIVEVFMNKVRSLRGVRKMIVIEEAWKAIANSGMADEIRGWVKTLRKYMGKLALVSQDVEDIVDSPIIKQAVINSSDIKILLDQSKFQNRFGEIQKLLGITDKQKAEILSINKGHDPGRVYKDCWIGLGPVWSRVYRLETSEEEYWAYTSEEGDKVQLEAARECGSLEKAIEVMAERKRERFRVKGLMLAVLLLFGGLGVRAQIPIVGIITGVAQKVVMAIDLRVQKEQTETIELQDAQQDAQNSMEEDELSGIAGWLQKTKDLYAEYYNELWQIKNAISTYERIKQMIAEEGQIVAQVKQMNAVVGSDKHFTAGEVAAMTTTLSGIMNESVNNIKQLELVINAFVTQMADADRLAIIDGAGSRIDQNYADMQEFYQRSSLLSLERAQGESDIQATRVLYGLQ